MATQATAATPATTAWKLNGQHYETCNCDFICPCLPGQMAATPTHGACTFAMAFQIDRGRYGDVALDGLGFVVLGHTPQAMNQGNWSVGVVADERASTQQREAIVSIVSGAAGGPMAALSRLVGKFLGVESAPIQFSQQGVKWSVGAGIARRHERRRSDGRRPRCDRTDALRPYRASCRRPFRAGAGDPQPRAWFGIDWDDTSGRNNGQYAPFAWQGG